MTTNNAINVPIPVSATQGGSGLASPTAHAILIGEGASAFTPIVLGAGQILIGTTSSDPTATTLTPGTGISIVSATGSITISSTGAGTWVDQTTSSVTMSVNTGYTADDGSNLITFTLPATSTFGDWVEINGKGSGLFTIAQTTGQQIHFGNVASSLGAGGSVASTLQFDSIRIRCITANTIWIVVASQGNFTIT